MYGFVYDLKKIVQYYNTVLEKIFIFSLITQQAVYAVPFNSLLYLPFSQSDKLV